MYKCVKKEKNMGDILEALMVILFGISWPINIYKAFRCKTAKGTSILFYSFIEIGYICGIISKFIKGNINWVLAFYFLNLVMVGLAICIYFRNKHLDKINGVLYE